MKLLPTIIQNNKKKILMLGWSNKKTIKLSIKIGYSVFFSRKRNKLWIKGEKSKNFQIIKKIYKDCDNDSYLFIVIQVNNKTCHKNKKSCFFKCLKN
ncbi:MAG: phosphoribosyl-AMP cyclohydrolase [Candidatus Vidania fulgoroideorum]